MTRARSPEPARLVVPRDADATTVRIGDRAVGLTNLDKVFFPALGLRKRDLLQYYADVAPVLIPHLRGRPLVMKRYPHGADGAFFFMKRAPVPRPAWIRTCAIEHASGNVIDFPVIDDLASLLWVVNLGCIDLNPWYSSCDDIDRPDYLNFDLDPPKEEEPDFARLSDVAVRLRAKLADVGLRAYVKTSGSRGLHLYVGLERKLLVKEIWTFAKACAQALEAEAPELVTAQYRIAKRPPGRILVDYNQNAWGRTLASAYSVRPTPRATVSTPLAWEELERGVATADFRIDNVPQRVAERGDPWADLT